MKLWRDLSVLILAAVVWATAAGNDIRRTSLGMETLSMADGLSSNQVFAIAQDSVGYIWLGTENGVNRYDGKTFRHYSHSPYGELSISDSRVNCILTTRGGDILIGTERGLNIYVADKDIIVPFAKTASINDCNIRILTEENGNLWIGTNDGLFCLESETGKISHYDTQNSGLVHNTVRAIHIDRDYMFIGTFDGMSRFNRRTNQWSSIDLKPAYFHQPLNNLVLSVMQSPYNKETLLVGTQTGLCELNKSTLDFHVYEKSFERRMSNNTIKAICLVGGEVWLGTEEGLMVFDGRKFRSYGYDPTDLHSLPNNIVWGLLKDRSNIVWLATEAGVAKYDAAIPDFEYGDFTRASGNPYVGMSVFAAQLDGRGRMWLGSRFGLCVYDPCHGSMRWVGLSNDIDGTYNFIKGLWHGADGILWVGTAEGVTCYDTVRDREIPVQSRLKNRLKYINGLATDKDGTTFASDVLGRVQIIKSTFDTVTREFRDISDRLILLGESVSSMGVKDKYVWFGTPSNGMLRYDKNNGEIRRYYSSPEDGSTLNSNVIYSLFVESLNGGLYVGTGNGLNRYDNDTDSFQRILSDEISGSIHTVNCDSSGLLWLATQHDIVCYDPLERSSKIFPLSHWFDRRNNLPSVSLAEGDDIYIFGIDSYLKLNKADIRQNRRSAPLYITDIKVAGISFAHAGLAGTSADPTQKLRLTHSRNTLSVCFAMLDYSTPSITRYNYRMTGYDKQWKTISGANAYVDYTNLAPGRYKLMANAISGEGIYASNSISLDIVVIPPWWGRWWAYSLYAAVIAATVLYIRSVIRKRHSMAKELEQEKIQREKIEEMNQLKMHFFTNISHDFRTPLSLIISPIETLMDEEKDPDRLDKLNIIRQNALRLLRLVNQILDFRKVENHKMVLEPVRGDFVASLRNAYSSFTELAARKNILLLFESTDQSLFMDFDPDKIDKIFINLISNALKYTPENGQVLINVQRKDNGNLEVLVADTGIGIPDVDLPYIFNRFYQVEDHVRAGKKGTGIGLVIVKEFVELHGGKIDVLSRPGEGTTFIVNLPIVNEADELTGAGDPQKEPLTPEGADRTKNENGDKSLVLLVEDNEDMRSYLRSEFEKYYSVLAARDAESGLKIINENMPDIVISDIMLPGMNGLDFCRKIKGDFVTSHIPVLLLTAKTAEEHVIEGFDAGSDEYIGKPFNLKVLKSRVENILRQRQTFRENLRRNTITLSQVDKLSPDQAFINRVVALIEENISDPELNIPFMCDKLAVSHINFYRKVKSITGMNVNAFIREIRLKKAAQLLRIQGMSVTDAMYDVGFNHRSYFSMCFRERFGVTPKAYAKQHNNENNTE